MPPSQILFHDRLFAGWGGVDDGLGIDDLFFKGLDLGDEFLLFVQGRHGHPDIAHYLCVDVGLIDGFGCLALGLGLKS